MGESGVLLDTNMQPLAPMIAWFDRRTAAHAAWWRSEMDPWSIYQITGLIVDGKFSVNHMLWLREHDPERFGVLAIHAEGSLEAEKLMLHRSYDPARARDLVQRLAGG